MKTTVLTIFTALTIVSCAHNTKSEFRKNDVPNPANIDTIADKASAKIEAQLYYLRIMMFEYCLSNSKKQSMERVGAKPIETTDYHDLSSTIIFQGGGVVKFSEEKGYTFIDNNAVALIKKWLKKDYMKAYEIDYCDANEDGKGGIDMLRAIDFYNSKDLGLYIDSVRQELWKNTK